MKPKTFPAVFSIDIGDTYPDDHTQPPIPPAPESWLTQIVEQADAYLSRLDAAVRAAQEYAPDRRKSDRRKRTDDYNQKDRRKDRLADRRVDRMNWSDCLNARQHAQEALQAISEGNWDAAMRSVFLAGRCVEKFQKSFPIQTWLIEAANADYGRDLGRERQTANAADCRREVLRLYDEMAGRGIVPRHERALLIENKLKGTKYARTARAIREIMAKDRPK